MGAFGLCCGQPAGGSQPPYVCTSVSGPTILLVCASTATGLYKLQMPYQPAAPNIPDPSPLFPHTGSTHAHHTHALPPFSLHPPPRRWTRLAKTWTRRARCVSPWPRGWRRTHRPWRHWQQRWRPCSSSWQPSDGTPQAAVWCVLVGLLAAELVSSTVVRCGGGSWQTTCSWWWASHAGRLLASAWQLSCCERGVCRAAVLWVCTAGVRLVCGWPQSAISVQRVCQSSRQ